MQNRYTGDIGDYGKLGLLRALQASGFSVGVNWYLVPDETGNGDGRYVQYLKSGRFRLCDESLWLELKQLVDSEQRNVSALENEAILKARFHSVPLCFSGNTKPERIAIRKEWHGNALRRLSGLDLVFTDPDNGLLVPSAAEKPKENKFVKAEELADYFRHGSDVIYYQHKARRPDRFYIDQHRQLMKSTGADGVYGFGLKFTAVSQRYFFFLVHPARRDAVSAAVRKLLSSAWSDCFEWLSCGD